MSMETEADNVKSMNLLCEDRVSGRRCLFRDLRLRIHQDDNGCNSYSANELIQSNSSLHIFMSSCIIFQPDGDSDVDLMLGFYPSQHMGRLILQLSEKQIKDQQIIWKYERIQSNQGKDKLDLKESTEEQQKGKMNLKMESEEGDQQLNKGSSSVNKNINTKDKTKTTVEDNNCSLESQREQGQTEQENNPNEYDQNNLKKEYQDNKDEDSQIERSQEQSEKTLPSPSSEEIQDQGKQEINETSKIKEEYQSTDKPESEHIQESLNGKRKAQTQYQEYSSQSKKQQMSSPEYQREDKPHSQQDEINSAEEDIKNLEELSPMKMKKQHSAPATTEEQLLPSLGTKNSTTSINRPLLFRNANSSFQAFKPLGSFQAFSSFINQAKNNNNSPQRQLQQQQLIENTQSNANSSSKNQQQQSNFAAGFGRAFPTKALLNNTGISSLSSGIIFKPESMMNMISSNQTNPNLFLSRNQSGSQLQQQLMQQTEQQLLLNSQSTNNNSSTSRQSRNKERTIREAIQMVTQWRDLQDKYRQQHQARGLQEVADELNISKKVLDYYFQELRTAEFFGFDFMQHLDSKMGVLRKFIEDSKKMHENENRNFKITRNLQFKFRLPIEMQGNNLEYDIPRKNINEKETKKSIRNKEPQLQQFQVNNTALIPENDNNKKKQEFPSVAQLAGSAGSTVDKTMLFLELLTQQAQRNTQLTTGVAQDQTMEEQLSQQLQPNQVVTQQKVAPNSMEDILSFMKLFSVSNQQNSSNGINPEASLPPAHCPTESGSENNQEQVLSAQQEQVQKPEENISSLQESQQQ